jgi:eukaryotic-like serine/threonine-protein kinase
MIMPIEHQCPKCGAVLSADAPKGLCPRCLLGAALAPTLPAAAKPTIRIEAGAEEEISARIDRYKILQKLGEGGCGVVYMAEQTEPVRRKVALKVIKLGMDTKQVIARFEAERQALALMDHPNIAKVLDAGTTEKGRPFFVMELVKGIRITDYCDQNHLSTPERLALFTQVCQAIQHAHQKGIIHRDIKPSNILVTLHDGVPVPKVIDFGIAKATEQALTEKTVFTAFGQFMGTPAYMSPEQAELSGLDIDTRSDIYALGVLLYELLTGKTPFDAKELLQAGLDEMRRRIREEEPIRPSTRLSTMVAADLTEVAQQRHSEPTKLTRFIRGDLDWIVMKCLEKDRTRRYETANGLAADIRRHLVNEPVMACPPSAAYRFQKMVRRNKLAVGAATAVAVALVIGLSLSTWMYLREKQARHEAVARAQSERKAKEAEAAARKQAQAVSDYLIRAFRSPDPARDGRTITIVEVLDRDAQELLGQFADDPLTKAMLLLNIAHAYVSLGLVDRSLPLFEQAVEQRNRCLGAEAPDTLWAKQDLALHYWVSGRSKQALPLTEEVFRVRQEQLGRDHSDTLGSQMAVANCYLALGRTQEGLDMMERSYKVLKSRLGAENTELFWATTGMADVYRSLGRTQAALELDEPLLKFRREKMGLDQPETLHSMRAVAQDYIELGRLDDAAVLLQDAVKLSTTRLGPDHSQTLLAIRSLAEVLRGQGKLAEAEELIQGRTNPGGQAKSEVAALPASPAPAGVKAGAPEVPTELAVESEEPVNSLVRAGKLPEATLELLRIVKLQPTNHVLAGPIFRLAEVCANQGRLAEAESLGVALLELRNLVLGNGHPETVDARFYLASLFIREAKLAEAAALYREIAEAYPTVAGHFYGRAGRWKEAAAAFARNIESEPDKPENYRLLAPILLFSEDIEGYRKICHQLVTRFTANEDPVLADGIVRVCLLRPDSGVDSSVVAGLADTAIVLGKQHEYLPWFELGKALAEYRQEHFASAANWAQKALDSAGQLERDASAYVVLAMAQWQLKQPGPARVAMGKAAELVDAKLPRLDGGDNRNWVDVIGAHLLLREARALIQESGRHGPDAPKAGLP